MPTLFLLYHELFSDRELFTDNEFRDTCTSAPPHVMHALHVASSACSFLLYRELFSDHELFSDRELFTNHEPVMHALWLRPI